MSNDDKASYRGGPIIAALALPLLLLAAYVGGYFGLSEFMDNGLPSRAFNANWQVAFFRPALMIEKRCRGDLWVREPTKNVVGGIVMFHFEHVE